MLFQHWVCWNINADINCFFSTLEHSWNCVKVLTSIFLHWFNIDFSLFLYWTSKKRWKIKCYIKSTFKNWLCLLGIIIILSYIWLLTFHYTCLFWAFEDPDGVEANWWEKPNILCWVWDHYYWADSLIGPTTKMTTILHWHCGHGTIIDPQEF